MPIRQAVPSPTPFGGPHVPSRLLGGKWWGLDQIQKIGHALRDVCLCSPTGGLCAGLCAKSRPRGGGSSMPEVRQAQ